MQQTDFLVVETGVGTLGIFPGHADHERDEAFARSTGHRIIQRCSTREEAADLVSKLTEQAVPAALSRV